MPSQDNKPTSLLREILEAVRKGGYYDAIPNERKPDYLDVDVAMAAIEGLIPEKHINTTPELADKHIGFNQAINQIHRNFKGKGTV